MSIIKLTNDNFDEMVIKSDKTVLIDFYAKWCGPCRMVSPIVDEISEQTQEYRVCKADVDEEPELAQKFGVSNIPTLVVVKNGKIANQCVGARSKEFILSMMNE